MSKGHEQKPPSLDDLGLDAFFAGLRPEEARPSARATYRPMLRRMEARQSLLKEHFSDRESFQKYVKAHPRAALAERRIDAAVALHRHDWARITKEQGDFGQGEASALEQYRAMVNAGYVEPNDVFSEVPAVSSLAALSDMYRKARDELTVDDLRRVRAESDAAMTHLTHRLHMITGERLHPGELPPVSKVTEHVAPAPYRATSARYAFPSEAERMGHAPLIDLSRWSTSSGGGGGAAGASTGGASSASPSGSGSTGGAAGSGGGAGAAGDGQCNIEEIYRMAGANVLRQPAETGGGYTFPEREPGRSLRWGEDIFYDHVVMIPLPGDDDVPSGRGALEKRDLKAAQLIAGFAHGLLDFLSSRQLGRVLGSIPNPSDPANPILVIDEVRSVLREVSEFPEVTLPSQPNTLLVPKAGDVRKLRRKLRGVAASLRSVSHARMLLPRSGANPFTDVVRLESALRAFPAISREQKRVPTHNIGEVQYPTLTILDINQQGQAPPEDAVEPHATQRMSNGNEGPKIPGRFFVPDADDEASLGAPPTFDEIEGEVGTNADGSSRNLELEWFWADAYHNSALRRYVQYLGGTFYDKLVELRAAAGAISQSIRAFAGSASSLTELDQLAAGSVNDILLALGRLLDEIAEKLDLLPATKPESSKRLALMVTFRQYWYPDGYIAGKLVGYKNLLPNQRDTFKRRTFVKTTRETTTVEEFAASRDEDFSRSSKETADVMKEASSKFHLSLSASGSFDFFVVGGDYKAETSADLGDLSRETHNRITEAAMKSSAKYSEKREVKIRELTEVEDMQEVTTEVQNLNREITANYFYYQLYRQYCVESELHSVRPVLLRSREVPSPGSVDEKFLTNYAHVLVHVLPRQLSSDLQATASEVEPLGRTMVRYRVQVDEKSATFEAFQRSTMPTTPEGQSQWRAQLETLQRDLSDTRLAHIAAEESYLRAKTRLDRVLAHVRENIRYYMRFIWQASPTVDQDRLLQEPEESFRGRPLADVTRGLTRVGYFGDEEIFEYTGYSVGAMEKLLYYLVPGHQIVAGLTDEQIMQTSLFRHLRVHFPADTDAMLIQRIRTRAFVVDPAGPEEIDNVRNVQIAQDALIVEAMPGQVPLLEGFQMAHRMLDVQEKCLQNRHLRERINDRPWENGGEDSYRVIRREGSAPVTSPELSVDPAHRP